MSNCSPELILDYLNRARVRCTYTAFTEVLLGSRNARLAGRHLGDPRPSASWVVAKSDGNPTDYAEHNKHPELYRTSYIITTGEELLRCMRRNVTEFRNESHIAPPGRTEGSQ